ncbi:MAG: ExeM/NucH family extracellular endonuclease, partial [Ilumatobacteraceae bacterium]
TEPLGQSLQLTGAGTTYGEFTWSPVAAASPGAINTGQSFTGAPPPPPPPPPPPACPAAPAMTPIGQVQGVAETSPCAGLTVAVEGVVVGDYEGPSPALRGFYVQEQDDQHDVDPATSEGIFVFNGNNNSVALGDVVVVTGSVSEFQGQTQLSATTSGITVLASGAVATPATVTMPFATAASLEAVEGMLVVFPQELTVSEHFQLGRFGEIVVSSGGRLLQPTAVAEPGADAGALQAVNNLNRLKVDDALQNQNPDPILLGRGGAPTTAANPLRGGDTITGLTGVMTYTWAGNGASPNAYRLRPIGDLSDSGLVPGGVSPAFVTANARPSSAPAVGGTVKISNFNVLNYFLSIDDNTIKCGPTGHLQECRGAESSEELTRQRDKLLTAIGKIDADVIGLIELENTTGVEPLADIVAGLNARAGATVWAYIDTGTIGNDVIRVGIVYKAARVTPIGHWATIDSTVDPRFDSSLNRPSLAQSFVDGTGEVATVVVNHLKSKGCTDAVGSQGDQLDGQGCWNPARAQAAAALVDWVAGHPTGVEDDDFLLIGDLNSYAKEDPIDVFASAGFVDLAQQFNPGSYSYVFDGQWGSLDYALASPSLVAQVTGANKYHINSDEPAVLDYNTNFKSAGQIASLYAPDEFRTSDHDPVVVGVRLAGIDETLIVLPTTLRPANHTMRLVLVGAVTRWRFLDTALTSVVSSEADSGVGAGDKPNDIQVLDPHVVLLRAERYAAGGRTYTLTVQVRDGGQLVVRTAQVRVP